jgi:hypothetical protein
MIYIFEKSSKNSTLCKKRPFLGKKRQKTCKNEKNSKRKYRCNTMKINILQGHKFGWSKSVHFFGQVAKTAIFALFLALSTNCYGQKFNGIYIGGTMQNFILEMKNKGYKLENYDGTFATFSGKIDYENVTIYVSNTPKTKIVSKLSVYYEKKQSWEQLVTQFNSIKSILETKYTATTDCFTKFKYPYEEGDGYELNALILNKVDYVCFWLDMPQHPNLSISLEISKFQKVLMSYENVANIDLAIKEKNQINNATY